MFYINKEKKLAEVCSATRSKRKVLDLPDLFSHVPHVGRLVRFPRCGTGARYGESVSIIRRSRGTARATSFRSLAFLNVTIPEGNLEVQGHCLLRNRQAFRETVHDAAHFRRHPSVIMIPQRIVRCSYAYGLSKA